MINRAFQIVFLILMLGACSSKEAEKTDLSQGEFDVFCTQFGSLTRMLNYDVYSSEDRASKLEEALAKLLRPSSSAYIAWTAIRNGPPAERYALYRAAAESTGYKNWVCPEIAKHGHEVGSQYD